MQIDPSWLTDERIREIKQGDDATRREVLALAGEVRVRRREQEGMPDLPVVIEQQSAKLG